MYPNTQVIHASLSLRPYALYLRFSNLILYIVLCQEGNEDLFILDISDQNITYVFASDKGIQATYSSLHFLGGLLPFHSK